MIAYKFVVKDIYTNEKREFELFSEDKDPRPVHKEGMRQIKFCLLYTSDAADE